MPDTPGIRPVSSHPSGSEQRLVKEEMIINQLLLFLFCHLGKWVVFPYRYVVVPSQSSLACIVTGLKSLYNILMLLP